MDMKMLTLDKLLVAILFLQPEGIARVRLAKLTYLVYKGLLQKKYDSLTGKEIVFVRMPLGPVPQELKEVLATAKFGSKREKIGLSYNRQVFYLVTKEKPSKTLVQAVDEILEQISYLSSGEMVEYCHHEPSWRACKNGEDWVISEDDLKRWLPQSKHLFGFGWKKGESARKINPTLDDQFLQARLIDGMLEEIIEESTLLEYPEEARKPTRS
jgi:uncharacterized phage-associated protein